LSTSYNSTSAASQSVYNTVNAVSGENLSTYNTVSTLSASWQSTFNALSSLSANWQNTFTTVSSTSANWQNCYTTLTATSAKWSTLEVWGYFPATFAVGNIYQFNEGAFRAGTLAYMNLRLSAGFGTVALNQNGTSTGTYAISSKRLSYTPNIAYALGDTFSITFSSVSAASNLSYSLGLTYY